MKRINLESDGAHRFVSSWIDIPELFASTSPSALSYLSLEETKIFNGFAVEKRKREWLAGRVATKLGLEALMSPLSIPCLFPDASILNGLDRAPYFTCTCETPHHFSFSISHAHQLAGAYLTNDPRFQLGIDIVFNEPRDPLKLRGFLTPAELDLIFKFQEIHQSRTTNIIWAVKESVSKALKLGMAIVPSIEVQNISEFDNILLKLSGKAMASLQKQNGREITCHIEDRGQYFIAYAKCFVE